MSKPYEFTMVLNPTTEEAKVGTGPKLLMERPKLVMAKDETAAAMLAGRAIPDDQIDNVDRIEVFVRPF